ncbi:hypothetical protein BV372_13030 [Nostoc sp. T09]|uniref:class I SAM-dependent methyltransferase n=1 Tax=Nostoc sp. T09 TaxID=1932621 RepID=UPI000A392910|nr:class I SAM-dependent methyltransferase [Nostoc sp. T09]OUL34769.1 hypothetical protein BV372_13030 [Nostoc sp. T09]
MNQDQIFLEREGNQWFKRNKKVLVDHTEIDWALHLIDLLKPKREIKNIVDLGCANGWRLNQLSEKFGDINLVGIDASLEAIQDGKQRYPHLNLYQGLLKNIPINYQFDLVIIGAVMHWIDRENLVKTIAEIDRLTADGGILLLGDFLPDYPQRRHYHHLPNEQIYTYKQDYAKIFEALVTYKEIAKITSNHDQRELGIQVCDSSSRWVCTLLQKSLQGFYQEVT